MKRYMVLSSIVLALLAKLPAQTEFDEIHLFQSFMRDATITTKAYDEVFIDYSNYSAASLYALGLQGGFAITPELEFNGKFGIGGFSPQNGAGETGLTDLTLSARYLIYDEQELRVTIGGGISLPVGEEEAGYDHFAMGGFAALRYPLNENMLLTGAVGLDVMEGHAVSDESETSLSVAGGLVYLRNDRLALVGELTYRSNLDYALLSLGADYLLTTTRIRGALGIGLDDGAPDVRLLLGYIFSF